MQTEQSNNLLPFLYILWALSAIAWLPSAVRTYQEERRQGKGTISVGRVLIGVATAAGLITLVIGAALVLKSIDLWMPGAVVGSIAGAINALLVLVCVAVVLGAKSSATRPRGDWPPSAIWMLMFILNPPALIATIVIMVVWDRLLRRFHGGMNQVVEDVVIPAIGFGFFGTAIWFAAGYGIAALVAWAFSA